MGNGKDKMDGGIGNFSLGNPAMGLSDAIVGGYTYVPVPVDGGGSDGGDNSGGSDDSGGGFIGGAVEIIKDYLIGKLVDTVVDKIGKGGCCCCCCGGGSGYLIDESEIVL